MKRALLTNATGDKLRRQNFLCLNINKMDIFPWANFNEDLRLYVLKYLNIKQLVAVERVNKKMQSDVLTALLVVKKLAIPDSNGGVYVGFCSVQEHQFVKADAVNVDYDSQASLIKKLPNLVAITIEAQVGPAVIAALSKCHQLRHLAIRNPKYVNSKKLDWSNIECTSFRVSKLDPAKCPNMKFINGQLSSSNMEMLLKNGLLGIVSDGDVSDDCRELIFKHGHRIRVLMVAKLAFLYHHELERLNNDFGDLSQIWLSGSRMSSITFGHRLTKIVLQVDTNDNQLLAVVKDRCPNLSHLFLFGTVKLDNVATFHNLQFLFVSQLNTSEESLRAFLDSSANLRNLSVERLADYSMQDSEVLSWVANVNRDFPKLVGLRWVLGINDKPESDDE